MKKTKERRKKNWEKQKGDENNGEVMSLMRPYMLGNPPSVERKERTRFGIPFLVFLIRRANRAKQTVLCQHHQQHFSFLSFYLPP